MKQTKSFLAASVTALLIMATMALGQDTGYGQRDRGRSDRDTMTVPSGTQIAVRTDEAIDSQNASEGQTFPATVLQDVTGGAGEVRHSKGFKSSASDSRGDRWQHNGKPSAGS